MRRSVFYLSDGTGITAKALGQSLLTQFDTLEFDQTSIPYIDSIEKADDVLHTLEEVYQRTQLQPLVFSTFINRDILSKIQQSKAEVLDFLQTFIPPLEGALHQTSSHTVGRAHGLINHERYNQRIEAVNYTLMADDGALTQRYEEADLILMGVSRCGKTPTCLYMAMQFGLFMANYPITEDDIQAYELPAPLRMHQHRLFGLTIDLERLFDIRQARRPNSSYASLEQCERELRQTEAWFTEENIPFINTTVRSIEEIATQILIRSGLKPKI